MLVLRVRIVTAGDQVSPVSPHGQKKVHSASFSLSDFPSHQAPWYHHLSWGRTHRVQIGGHLELRLPTEKVELFSMDGR